MSRQLGSKFLFLATGLVLGAAAGILFAPEEGRNTRGKLSFQLGRYRSRLSDLIGKMREVEKQAASTAQTESEKVIAETKQEAERLLGHVDALMQQIKDKKSGA